MWGTDMTATAAVSVAVDHCSAERTGIHGANTGNRFEALALIEQRCVNVSALLPSRSPPDLGRGAPGARDVRVGRRQTNVE